MYEVFAKGEVEGQPESYIVLSPSGALIETYKINPLIPTSKDFASKQAYAHRDRMNRAWCQEAA